MIEMIKKYKNNVEVVSVDYNYSFANAKNHTQNKVQEYLFIGS
jgi:DNA adenine methylase